MSWIADEADMPSLLEASVLEALRPRVGDRLEAVQYRCLQHGAKVDDLSAPDFFFEGEVLLCFAGGNVFVTWQENAGWAAADFSVQARTSSAFKTGAPESVDVGGLASWRSLVGQPLVSAEVLGWGGAPAAIRLSFPTNSVIIGVGDGGSIGVGDDVVVRGAAFPAEEVVPEILWSSDRPDVIRTREAPPLETNRIPLEPRGILTLALFVLAVCALAVAPLLSPWLGVPVAIGVMIVASAGYGIGEWFILHILRLALFLGSIATLVLVIWQWINRS